MRYVGNVHRQAISALVKRLNRDGVIKVAGVRRVNRKRETVADVASQRIFKRLSNIELKRISLGKCWRGLVIREVVARHHAANAHIGCRRVSQPALNGHDARLHARGVAHNAGEHHVAQKFSTTTLPRVSER